MRAAYAQAASTPTKDDELGLIGVSVPKPQRGQLTGGQRRTVSRPEWLSSKEPSPDLFWYRGFWVGREVPADQVGRPVSRGAHPA
jgi:hypothetical protein